MSKTFPRLFKKTSTGAIQFWDIMAGTNIGRSGVGVIETRYGQLDTDSPQITSDVIWKGKNEGKKNATTAIEQAEAEAQSKWEKQKKKGYVESLESAENDELDDLIEGGIVPMSAYTFKKQGHKIKYPCYVQPKFDGIRCIAIVKDGKCTLWSRTRKLITSCPHIVEELERVFYRESITLDGELYNHSYKDNFEHIVHLVRQEEPDLQHKDVEYHIYDIVNEDKFNSRSSTLEFIFCKEELNGIKSPLKLVKTWHILENQVPEFYDEYKSKGYEGAMLRNSEGLYVNKRSSDLIKVKEMQDAEFQIIGIEEGRGKLAGHVGAFVCKNESGQEFKAKMSGSTDKLKEYFDNHKLWQDKLLTVQFQDLTSYGIPRFPVGLRFKEDI